MRGRVAFGAAGEENTSVRLTLVRHAAAYAGFDGLVSGPRACKGLTDVGRLQAEALRSYLAETGRIHADVLVASVLPRAIETAGIIAPALGLESVHQDCDLCEIHTGEADGLEWKEYDARYGIFDMEQEPERVFAPGGESWRGFHERVLRMCRRLATDYADQNVVAVCHAGFIMASMRGLLGVAPTAVGSRIQPTNTGITEWEHDPEWDRWTLHCFNETVHLRRLLTSEVTVPDDHLTTSDR